MVIFAHHRDVIGALHGAFGSTSVIYTGETSLRDRQAAVERFQTDESCKIFIGSISAASVGITLTKSTQVVVVEQDWVPGNMFQAEARLHRMGQRDTVNITHFVLSGSLDAKIAKVLIAKQKVIEEALDKDAGAWGA